MELVKISAGVCGYYSDATYEDNIFIAKETYEKVKEDVKKIEIYIYELDGKHSECEAEIDITEYTEEDLLTKKINDSCDGEKLYYELEEIFEKYNLDLSKEINIAEDYLKTLDRLTTVEFTVKESQVKLIKDFIASLSK